NRPQQGSCHLVHETERQAGSLLSRHLHPTQELDNRGQVHVHVPRRQGNEPAETGGVHQCGLQVQFCHSIVCSCLVASRPITLSFFNLKPVPTLPAIVLIDLTEPVRAL